MNSSFAGCGQYPQAGMVSIDLVLWASPKRERGAQCEADSRPIRLPGAFLRAGDGDLAVTEPRGLSAMLVKLLYPLPTRSPDYALGKKEPE